jgi:hypothetical protein
MIIILVGSFIALPITIGCTVLDVLANLAMSCTIQFMFQ